MNRRTLLTLAATAGVAAIAGASFSGHLSPAGDLLITPAQAATSEEMLQPGPLGEMALGDPKAPNIMIEYASVTCPHCAAFHESIFGELKEKYIDTGKVYFIFREYSRNPLDVAAFMLARCGPKERYFPLVDLMFDRQAEWAFTENPKADLLAFVRQAGFTEESFNACLTNQEIQAGVVAVRDRASSEFDVSGTPTFFINGERYGGELSLEEIDEILAD